jgi:hypothetical protein
MEKPRNRRLRVLAALSAVFVGAFVYAAAASAATPSSVTVGASSSNATFTGDLTATNFLPATCDTDVTPTCAPGTSPSPCPLAAEDPANAICEHEEIVVTDTGPVAACVAFPAGDDVDLYVVQSDSLGDVTLVASSTTSNNPECVSFDASAGATYELDINPFFISEATGATITGTVTFGSGGGGTSGGGTGGGTTGTPVASEISSNFNGTEIPAGSCIWFNAPVKLQNVPSTGLTLNFDNSTVVFNSNNPNVHNVQHLPSMSITFDAAATKATLTYDAAANRWREDVPLTNAQVFLDGYMMPVPSGLPGGINPVKWSGTFSSTAPVQLQWQWGAAVYTGAACNADYNSLGVKPTHTTNLDAYPNGDQAGTPENFKPYVIGGARGGGGANYTGSWSGTAAAQLD